MKKLMSILLLLLSSKSFAGFVGSHYSQDQLRFETRCEIPICRSSDYGKEFVSYCNFQRQSTTHIGQPVYVWIDEDYDTCYCPCDYAFENKVTSQN